MLTVAVAYVGPDPSIKIIPSSEALDIAYRERMKIKTEDTFYGWNLFSVKCEQDRTSMGHAITTDPRVDYPQPYQL